MLFYRLPIRQPIKNKAIKYPKTWKFSCRFGNLLKYHPRNDEVHSRCCSSCIARVTEGDATMRQNNILTDSEVAEGLVLTCQAHPTTATVVVDYDDV